MDSIQSAHPLVTGQNPNSKFLSHINPTYTADVLLTSVYWILELMVPDLLYNKFANVLLTILGTHRELIFITGFSVDILGRQINSTLTSRKSNVTKGGGYL